MWSFEFRVSDYDFARGVRDLEGFMSFGIALPQTTKVQPENCPMRNTVLVQGAI